MNKYEFYSTILQEDFPVKYREVIADNDCEQRKEIRELREALARVEAELSDIRHKAFTAAMARDTAQAQLAEAVGLLRSAEDLMDRHIMSSKPEVAMFEMLDNFLARHAQAEQQEAKPVAVESQGAQAGGEREAFEHWASDGGMYPKAVERRGDQYKLAQTHSYWQAWQARAALATQPVVLPTDPASWPLKVGADEFVGQQEKWPDTAPSDFMHDALYEMIRVLTKPAGRGAEHGQ